MITVEIRRQKWWAKIRKQPKRCREERGNFSLIGRGRGGDLKLQAVRKRHWIQDDGEFHGISYFPPNPHPDQKPLLTKKAPETSPPSCVQPFKALWSQHTCPPFCSILLYTQRSWDPNRPRAFLLTFFHAPCPLTYCLMPPSAGAAHHLWPLRSAVSFFAFKHSLVCPAQLQSCCGPSTFPHRAPCTTQWNPIIFAGWLAFWSCKVP